MIVIVSGLSGSGKSTISKMLADTYGFFVLDGDSVRTFFGGELGFGEGARMESGRRLCFGAHLLSQAGRDVVITCQMGTPEIRKKMKKMISFYEIFMDANIEDCIKNDPKGIYKQNLRKDRPYIRGYDLKFFPPSNPDLVLKPYRETPEESFEKVKKWIQKQKRLDTSKTES